MSPPQRPPPAAPIIKLNKATTKCSFPGMKSEHCHGDGGDFNFEESVIKNESSVINSETFGSDPDVVEIPVAPKPPPAIIDLDDDGQLGSKTASEKEENDELISGSGPGIQSVQSLGVGLDLMSQTISNYTHKFPAHYPCLPSTRTIEAKCEKILMEYKVTGVKYDPPHGSVPLKLMTLNYYLHLHKHQKEFDKVIHLIRNEQITAETLVTNWRKRTELNAHVEKFLIPTRGLELEEPTTTTPRTSAASAEHDKIRERNQLVRRIKAIGFGNLQSPTLLIEGKTELQSILRLNFSTSLPASAISKDEPWKDKWNPVNLSMPLSIFIITVQKRLRIVIERKSALENLIKNYYIEYMAKVAGSNQEFLLAVIATFGVVVRLYSGRILEFFQAKDMLHYTCVLDNSKVLPKTDKYNEDAMPAQNGLNGDILKKEFEKSRPIIELQLSTY